MLVIWLDQLCLKLTSKLDVPLEEGRAVLEVTRNKTRTNETTGLVKLRPHSEVIMEWNSSGSIFSIHFFPHRDLKKSLKQNNNKKKKYKKKKKILFHLHFFLLILTMPENVIMI